MKINYFYGTMKSSKTAQMLMMYNNYKIKGINPILMKPSVDTRSSNLVSSRIGLSNEANFIIDENNVPQLLKIVRANIQTETPILIDECQFVAYDTVVKMVSEALKYDTEHNSFSINAFGLLTDMNGKLFDGSRAWVEQASKLIEVKTLCSYCSAKAVRNLFTGKQTGSNIVIGDSEYIPVCARHYYQMTHKGEK